MSPSALFTAFAVALILVGLGGIAAIVVRDVLTGLKRKSRLLDGAGARAAPAVGTAGLALDGLVGGVRRFGEGTDNRDPGKLSALRHRLMLAGFVGQDAVAFYLGARSLALIAAMRAAGAVA